ncbi:MAG: Protein involved in biosynthesis of mitomycin antibiotics/polyketide fumonisin, partial [Chthonomonadales bacterium]|nr:Protein involved in biosynthesis of mitomycin antibiotics/polyketide fumonisin [Chthonomonadales bacterium]
MRTELTEDQITQYQKDGFLVVPNFLDAAELAHWQQTTQEAVDQRLET